MQPLANLTDKIETERKFSVEKQYFKKMQQSPTSQKLKNHKPLIFLKLKPHRKNVLVLEYEYEYFLDTMDTNQNVIQRSGKIRRYEKE